MEAGTYRIEYGQEVIAFTLTFGERPRLTVTVHPDKRVEVVAPTGRSVKEVLARVRRRASWIIRQLDHFDRFHPLPPARRYVGGETHCYLGRQYRLRLVAVVGPGSVKLHGKYLQVHTADREDVEGVKSLLDYWYREHAQAVFARRLPACHAAVGDILVIPCPGFQLRRMTNRWGSCTKAGRILLNPDLVKAPLSCIDYVVTHELCHLKVLNHGPEFYRLLSRCMPDWGRRKERLGTFVV